MPQDPGARRDGLRQPEYESDSLSQLLLTGFDADFRRLRFRRYRDIPSACGYVEADGGSFAGLTDKLDRRLDQCGPFAHAGEAKMTTGRGWLFALYDEPVAII